jgi:hypothetical protein
MSSRQMDYCYFKGVFEDLTGPEGGDVSSLKWDSGEPTVLWCGTAAGELYFRTLSGSWKRVEPPFRPMMKIESIEITAGIRKSLLVLSRNGTIARSSDNGKTWKTDFSEIAESFVRAIIHQPLHPGFVLVGSQRGLFYSPDSGLTWQRFRNWNSNLTVTAIAFDNHDPLTFFVADSDGFNARVLMTTNGGYTFEPILEGGEYFSQIHTLVYQNSTQMLWAAGSGYSWRTARAHVDEYITWSNQDKGLPVSAVTCMIETPDHDIVMGSNGGGLYKYSDNRNVWKRIDIEPQRRYVRCLAASPYGLAAGFSENGIAIEHDNDWHESNRDLYARNISRIQRFGNSLAVVANEQLFMKNQKDIWTTVPGFQLVQDILVHGPNLYTSGLYSGVFQKTAHPDSNWKNLNLPVSRAALVRTDSNGELFVLTHLKRDRIRFFKYCTDSHNSHWQKCCPDLPISGSVHDFAVDCQKDVLSIAISTSQGLFCFNSDMDSWISSFINDSLRITRLYRSRLKPDILYAAAERKLLRSFDFGRFSDYHCVSEFPSKISSLTLSGLHFETIWISTENGGVYVSHFPNCWNALQPAELSLPINQIAVDTVLPGRMFCGTQGISCWKVSIPSLAAELKPSGNNLTFKLVFTYHNPGPAMDIDVHYLLLKPNGTSFEYLSTDSENVLISSSKPVPYRMTLLPETRSEEIIAGDVSLTNLESGLKPAVAFCVPEKFHPVCDIQTVSSLD